MKELCSNHEVYASHVVDEDVENNNTHDEIPRHHATDEVTR